MITDFLDGMFGSIFDFLTPFLAVFPPVPADWDTILNSAYSYVLVQEILSWINWFMPFDIAALIVTAWCSAMLIYIGIRVATNSAKLVF